MSSQREPLQPLLANASELTASPESEDAEHGEGELRANASLLEILEEAPLYSAARSQAAALFDRLSDNATLGLSYARILKFMPPEALWEHRLGTFRDIQANLSRRVRMD